jgi:hypothetical protein
MTMPARRAHPTGPLPRTRRLQAIAVGSQTHITGEQVHILIPSPNIAQTTIFRMARSQNQLLFRDATGCLAAAQVTDPRIEISTGRLAERSDPIHQPFGFFRNRFRWFTPETLSDDQGACAAGEDSQDVELAHLSHMFQMESPI